MSDDPDENDGIYRLQTVPPPDGESDVYNAPTKVGPMATSVIQELIEHAQKTGGVVEAKHANSAIDTSKIAPAIPPPPPPPPPPPVVAEKEEAAPVIEKLDSERLAELVSQEEAALSDADRAPPRISSTPVRAAPPPPSPLPAPMAQEEDVRTEVRTDDAPITNAELGRNPHQRIVVIGVVLAAIAVVVWVFATKLMP